MVILDQVDCQLQLSFTKLYSPSNITRNFSVTISTTLTDGVIVGLTQNISVVPSDIIPPTVTPPINISVNTDPGLCEVVLHNLM